MPASILSIGTAVPPHETKQSDLVKFMNNYLTKERSTSRKIQVLFNLSGIKKRFSVVPDFNQTHESFTFFPKSKDLEPFPSTQRRMEMYQDHALDLAEEAVKDCLKDGNNKASAITHLITVSCTGMYAPGLDIELVERLGLSTQTERTAINFMGCYAAFNALKVARGILDTNPESKVLLVAVELCSLHFQKSTSDDALVSNTLFGDGAASLLLGKQNGGIGLSLESFHSDLALQGKREMGWFIKDVGFEMKLTGEVPRIIQDGIQALTNNLLRKMDLKISEIDFFAIHPGGRKILEVIEESLNISHTQNAPARNILAAYGNMSSPTVIFTLKEIFEKLGPQDSGKKILSFAFGPGLTLESMLLKINA